MILRGLKNFAKSIKYYFTPLGMITIFVTIGLFVAINGIAGAISTLFNDLAKTVGESSIDWGAVGNSLWGSITSLNWDLTKLMSFDWIAETLKGGLAATGLQSTIDAAANQITHCVGTIIGCLMGFLIMFILGIVVGYVLLYFQVRSGIMKTVWWKTILYGLLDIVIQIALIAAFIGLVVLWKPLMFILPLVWFIIIEMISIIQAYLLHGIKKIKFLEVFNPKVVGLCALSDAIITVSGLATVALIILIANPIVGLVIGLPLLEMVIIVSRFSAESYVVDKLDGTYDKEEAKRLERKQARKEKRAQKKTTKKGNA